MLGTHGCMFFKNYTLHMAYNFSYSHIWLTILFYRNCIFNSCPFCTMQSIFTAWFKHFTCSIKEIKYLSVIYIENIFTQCSSLLFNLYFVFIFTFKMLNIYVVKFIKNFLYAFCNFMSSWTWFFILKTFIHALWSFMTFFCSNTWFI